MPIAVRITAGSNLTRLLGHRSTVRHSKIVTRHLLAVKIFAWVLYF